MIIEKSLDKFLLSMLINEYNTREVVRALERLSQADDNVKLLPHLLSSVNSLALFKSGVIQNQMYSQIPTSTSHLLSLFSIDFVYDFFKSIVESCPPGQVNLKVLFNIFKDSFSAYAQEVGMEKLKKDMPMLDQNEILYINLLVNRFLYNDFSDVSRGFRNDTIN